MNRKKLDLLALASIPLVMTLGNSMLIPVLPMLEEALKHLRTMRNTWEEVIKSAKQKDRA